MALAEAKKSQSASSSIHLGESLDHDFKDRLTAAPARLIGSGNVQAVLGNVQVKTRQIVGSKLQQRLGSAEKLVIFERIFHFSRDLREAAEDILVNRRKVIVGHRVNYPREKNRDIKI